MAPKRKLTTDDIQTSTTSNEPDVALPDPSRPPTSMQQRPTEDPESAHPIINALGRQRRGGRPVQTVAALLPVDAGESAGPADGVTDRVNDTRTPAERAAAAQAGIESADMYTRCADASNVIRIRAGTFVRCRGEEGEGEGGIPMRGIKFVGFDHCHDELGVYFEIGTNRCFCARMAMAPWSSPHDEVPSEYHDAIINIIANELRKISQIDGWNVSDVIQNSLYLTSGHCPGLRSLDSLSHCDLAAVAVLRFLGRDAKPRIPQSPQFDKHGFVGEPGTGRGNIEKARWTDCDDNCDQSENTLASLGYSITNFTNVLQDRWKCHYDRAM